MLRTLHIRNFGSSHMIRAGLTKLMLAYMTFLFIEILELLEILESPNT